MLVMILGNSMNLYAAEVKEVEQGGVAVAYLVNKTDGEVIEVPITNESRTVERDGDQIKVTSTVDFTFPDGLEDGIQPNNVVTDGGVTTRISFEMRYTQSGTRYRLDEVKGLYEQLDKAFTMSDRVVTYISQQNFNKEPITKNPDRNDFSYKGDGSWVETYNVAQYQIAGYAKCTISRGGSSWELWCRETVIEQNPGSFI